MTRRTLESGYFREFSLFGCFLHCYVFISFHWHQGGNGSGINLDVYQSRNCLISLSVPVRPCLVASGVAKRCLRESQMRLNRGDSGKMTLPVVQGRFRVATRKEKVTGMSHRRGKNDGKSFGTICRSMLFLAGGIGGGNEICAVATKLHLPYRRGLLSALRIRHHCP